MEIVAILLFVAIFIFLLSGYPVAFVLGGLSVLAGMIFLGPEFFNFLPSRIMGVMNNTVLIAVPLFIYMGLMLERSGLAEAMLETMARLFGRMPGGLAVSVVVVGALLAASTGIVGATVVTMGLISLPVMLKNRYAAPLAAGTIAASGTLGQIIPPSVVLILLGSVLNVSVGDLFVAALLPGLLLVLCYVVYIVAIGRWRPALAPPMQSADADGIVLKVPLHRIVVAFAMPLLLICAVLGSIFAGIASPTEAAAVGAAGAVLLTVIQRRFTRLVLTAVMRETLYLTTMVFFILLGATTFALVFRGMGGDRFIMDFIAASPLTPLAFLAVVMVVVFIAGFFIDFIEIIFIIVPVVAPVFIAMGVDLIWVGVLLALNLQTSFLTPPFGFSLFYLKGVAPPQVRTVHIYRGVIPFLIIQLAFLVLVILFPGIVRVFL